MFINRAKQETATTGTGPITLGTAPSGFQTFADAGAVDGTALPYVIEDQGAWEIGLATPSASATVLARTVIETSNPGNAALNLSGNAVVYSGPSAADFAPINDAAASAWQTYSSDKIEVLVAAQIAARKLANEALSHSSGVITLDVMAGDVFEFEADDYNPGGVTVVGATKTVVNNDAAFDLPAGLLEGDVIFYCGMDYPSTPNPTGYTSLATPSIGGGITGRVSYKVMGAIPDTEITGLNAYQGAALALRGVDPAVLDAVTAAASDTSTGTTTDIDPAQITTVTDAAMSLVALFSEIVTGSQSQVEGAAISGYAEGVAATYEFSASYHYAAAFHTKEVATAGAENPPILSGGGHRLWATLTVPVRPAPPSGQAAYTLSLTNKPASGVRPILVYLEVKTAAGSWDVSDIDEWIGGAPDLNVVGVHAIEIHANAAKTKAEYKGLVA